MSLEDKLYPLLSLYEMMPRVMKAAAGACYRRLPESVRWGPHYREFKNLAEAGESWSRAQNDEYQFRELRQVLRHAARHSPFYHRRFQEAGFDPENFESFEDLQRCPMLEKRDLIEHREEIACGGVPPGRRLYITTGGSTGVPVGFYLQKGVSRAKEQAFLETIWKRGGYFEGARLALLRGHVVTSKVRGRISSYDPTRDWLMLSSYHLTPDRLPRYIEALEEFRPDLIHAYPSSILRVAEFLQETGLEWRLPLRGILCGSERLTHPQRRLVETVFKCQAYCWYGHAERVVLAAEGPRRKFFYFLPQYGYAEFGPPTAEGLREVIGTSFHNYVMPLIRYRTGDYVRLAEAEAGLEFPAPAALEIAGREQEFLVSAGGRKISLTAFNMHDSIFDHLYAVQFYQDRPGFAEFRYIPGPNFQSSRLAAIEAGIRKKLGDDFVLELKSVREVEKTPAGKHRWLISKLQ